MHPFIGPPTMSCNLMQIRIAVLVLAIYFSPSLFADPLAGKDEPDLQKAIDLWLDNNDSDSLATFSKLAKSGNRAARILLARIERTERAPSDYIERMSKPERMALFRASNNNNQFSPSWLLVESKQGSELARLFLEAGKPYVNLDLIQALRAWGEHQASDHPTRIAALYGTVQDKERLLGELALQELHPYVKSQLSGAGKIADGMQALLYILSFVPGQDLDFDADDADTRQAALMLALGIPYGFVNEDNKWYAPVSSWLLNDPATRPISRFCSNNCPDDSELCAMYLLGMTGGYYEVIRQDSPLEALISQDEFLESARAQAKAIRRASNIRAEHGGELITIKELEQHSQCLAQHVQQQRQSVFYK